MLNYFEKIYLERTSSFYKLVEDNLCKKKKMFIVTANPEIFCYGEKFKEVDKLLLDQNTTIIADGIGIKKSANILGYKVTERITGIDLAIKLLDICNNNKYKLCLLGAEEEVLNKLIQVIKKDYPNIKLGTCMHGDIKNKDIFFNKIKKENPDVCLVALGMPLQEELIYKHLNDFNKGIFVGVGGSFDVMSGVKKRAPKIFQKLNLEWLYRIIVEPKRIKRFYQNNIKFIFKIRNLKKSSKGVNNEKN